MVRRFDRSIYDELDELRASMDYLYQLALEPADNPLLPGEENSGVVCQYVHNLTAEVTDFNDEVMVTMDTVPGSGISQISVALQNEITLKMTYAQKEKRIGDYDGNRLCEQRSLALSQVIPLPVPVIKEGAKLSLKNGVLDLHFKKAQPAGMKKA
ncbi:MAG: Hsp20/alpha crystallin family protein [Methanoregula sp.]